MASPLRKLHRKTRTGCRTCKIRRVKCDETYPVCQRCMTMGRICDGYGVWGGGGALAQDSKALSQPVVSKPLNTVADTLLYRPALTSGLCVSSEEQIYLEWFLHGTATKPPRIFNSMFWDHTILQTTIHEPMILQALLALSAAHKRHILDPANRARDGLEPDPPEIFMLRHYGNAIKGLKNHLNNEKLSQTKLFAAATMCSLFVLTEIMRGHFETAYMHLTNGLHITKQLTDVHGLEAKIVKCFARFHDQAVLFRRQTAIRRSCPDSTTAPLALQLRFASPAEAGHYLDDLVEQAAYLAEQKRQMPSSAIASRAIHVDICRYLHACFESWSLTSKATLVEQGSTIAPSDAAVYSALRQRYQTAKYIIEECIQSKADAAN